VAGVDADFDGLVAEAVSAHENGWDFSWLAGRTRGSDPSWSYVQLARAAILDARSLLDVDTGGGELLAALAPLPSKVVATEAWEPNLPLARGRLAPLGVNVIEACGDALPVPAGSVDLVLNRHGALNATETARVLHPGGKLVTQQVGSDDSEELNTLLGAPHGHVPGSWTLEIATSQLEAVGMMILDAREEHPAFVFDDIAAVIFQLQKVAWQIPGFTPAAYHAALRALHRRIHDTGTLTIHSHRFLIIATK